MLGSSLIVVQKAGKNLIYNSSKRISRKRYVSIYEGRDFSGCLFVNFIKHAFEYRISLCKRIYGHCFVSPQKTS